MIRKGTRVLFEMKDGSDVEPPAKYALLHDPEGEDWPARSMLVGPYATGKAVEDVPSSAKAYLGRQYEIHKGSCVLPPRHLQEHCDRIWEEIGEVDTIYYYRHGTKASGDFRHKFGRFTIISLFKGRGKAVLYGWGEWLRLELPRGAIADDRGIVWP